MKKILVLLFVSVVMSITAQSATVTGDIRFGYYLPQSTIDATGAKDFGLFEFTNAELHAEIGVGSGITGYLTTNIETPTNNGVEITQAFAEWNFMDEHSLKVGKMLVAYAPYSWWTSRYPTVRDRQANKLSALGAQGDFVFGDIATFLQIVNWDAANTIALIPGVEYFLSTGQAEFTFGLIFQINANDPNWVNSTNFFTDINFDDLSILVSFESNDWPSGTTNQLFTNVEYDINQFIIGSDLRIINFPVATGGDIQSDVGFYITFAGLETLHFQGGFDIENINGANGTASNYIAYFEAIWKPELKL